MIFLIWMYLFTPTCTFRALLCQITIHLIPESDLHSLHRAGWHKTTQSLFLCVTTFWVRVLLPCHDLQSSWHSHNCVTPDHFPLYIQQAVTFCSLRSPPTTRQAFCIPRHLGPGTWPSSHTGQPSWSGDLAAAKNRHHHLEEILLYSWVQLLNGVRQ